MKFIQTDKAPQAAGPYSQATISGGFVFCSGQIALSPQKGELAAADTKGQTEQVLQNLIGVLDAAGSALTKVVSVTVYLRSMNDFKDMNEVYGRVFGNHKPARVTVGVSELPKSALVEISCVASLE